MLSDILKDNLWVFLMVKKLIFNGVSHYFSIEINCFENNPNDILRIKLKYYIEKIINSTIKKCRKLEN